MITLSNGDLLKEFAGGIYRSHDHRKFSPIGAIQGPNAYGDSFFIPADNNPAYTPEVLRAIATLIDGSTE